jgi:hypothetical protein
MAPGGKKEKGKVKLRVALLLLFPLTGGCVGLNDTLVRAWFQDREISNRVNSQIREGLEKRRSAPQRMLPILPAPAFLDQG